MFRKFPWKKLPIYAAAQILGALCAAGVVYANYKSAIDVFEGGASIRTVPGNSQHATAGIFCTYPQPFLSKTGQFFDEIIGTALLMFSIYALKDDNNLGAGNLTPLGLFFIVWGIGACFGYQTGYAINPARDFGPRLMSSFVGYGHHVWTAGDYYFWVSFRDAKYVCGTIRKTQTDIEAILGPNCCAMHRRCPLAAFYTTFSSSPARAPSTPHTWVSIASSRAYGRNTMAFSSIWRTISRRILPKASI